MRVLAELCQDTKMKVCRRKLHIYKIKKKNERKIEQAKKKKMYNTIQHNTIQYNTIQYNTIQYNTIQLNMLRYHQNNVSISLRLPS